MDRLHGWKGIAQFLGFSEKWCREAAKDPVDPLPTYHVGKGKQARRYGNPEALRAWEARRIAAGVSGTKRY